jgi:hypothetical protein
MAAPSVYRRRRLAALGIALLVVAVVVAIVIATGDDTPEPAARAASKPKPAALAQLPRGGRSLLPDRRIVAFYGAPQDAELGELGIGTPARAAARLERQARPYARGGKPVLPALELIAVVAAADAGEGGRYSTRLSDDVIRRYMEAARRAKALLVLDIQPGRSDFFTEVVRLQKWLEQPDVGLALDPEWRTGRHEIPGKVIGSVSAREVNAVSAWLSDLVVRDKLPEKLFLLHQFTADMIDDTALLQRRGLAMVLNADGFGGQEIKKAKYRSFTTSPRPFFHHGFKLFYHEDLDLMTPREVLRLRPPPDVVIYE